MFYISRRRPNLNPKGRVRERERDASATAYISAKAHAQLSFYIDLPKRSARYLYSDGKGT